MNCCRKRSFAGLRCALAVILLAFAAIRCCNAVPTPKPPPKGNRQTAAATKRQHISFDSLRPTPPEVLQELTAKSRADAKAAKLRNLQTRTLSAVVMLAALYGFVKLTGWTELVVFLQAAMYGEATTVAGVSSSPILKWGIGLVYLLAMDGRLLLSSSADGTILSQICTHLPLATFALIALGLVAWISGLNAPTNDIFVFQMNLSEIAACNLSGLLLIGFTSFWIRTLQEYGVPWIAYPALLVIANDTLAYFFGMLFGRNPLLPTISPKKTWEGLLGAMVGTLGIAKPLYTFLFLKNQQDADAVVVPMKLCLSMATYISVIAPFGGFLASVVKRSYGYKDFGSLFPGHGGFVDRLDCQVITAPFVYFLLQAFGVETTTAAAAAESTESM